MSVRVVNIFREIVGRVSENLTPQLQAVQSNIENVQFLTGHYTEINERLQSQAKTPSLRFYRFPLVALWQDFSITRGGTSFYGEANLNLSILYLTKREMYNEERYDTVIEPILYPIKEELERQIKNHPNFIVDGLTGLQVTETVRANWGNPAKYGNDGAILNDVLDGIDLKLRLTLQETCVMSLKQTN